MTTGTTRTIDSATGSEGLPETIETTERIDGDDANSFSRRRVFALCSLGVLGAAGLAACGGSSSASSDGDGDSDSAGAATSAAAAPAATTADSGGSATSSGGTVLTKLSDVPVGGAVALSVNGKSILVSQPTKGEAAAFSAVCPHQGGNVIVDGKIFQCTLHGSTFVEATGKNISGPAAGQPLPTVNVEVTAGNVVLKA
jgi:nitrite reductase/ring-hydroxylating ferredoxin subunit